MYYRSSPCFLARNGKLLFLGEKERNGVDFSLIYSSSHECIIIERDKTPYQCYHKCNDAYYNATVVGPMYIIPESFARIKVLRVHYGSQN